MFFIFAARDRQATSTSLETQGFPCCNVNDEIRLNVMSWNFSRFTIIACRKSTSLTIYRNVLLGNEPIQVLNGKVRNERVKVAGILCLINT